MSYDIYIGEAEVRLPDAEYVDTDGTGLSLTVRSFTHPEAPTFPNDEMTGSSNSRHPGYSQWSDFLKLSGLYELFFNKHTGLMSQHPGTFMLTKEHQAKIRERLSAWRATHSEPPGFAGFGLSSLDEQAREETEAPCDPILARLVWLEWWVTYALTNCKVPAIHNY